MIESIHSVQHGEKYGLVSLKINLPDNFESNVSKEISDHWCDWSKNLNHMISFSHLPNIMGFCNTENHLNNALSIDKILKFVTCFLSNLTNLQFTSLGKDGFATWTVKQSINFQNKLLKDWHLIY